MSLKKIKPEEYLALIKKVKIRLKPIGFVTTGFLSHREQRGCAKGWIMRSSAKRDEFCVRVRNLNQREYFPAKAELAVDVLEQCGIQLM